MILRAWLWAFLLTQAVEMTVYLLALRRAAGSVPNGSDSRWIWPRWLILAATPSAVTHPALWFILVPALRQAPFSLTYPPSIALAEALVIAIEGSLLWAFGFPRPWRLSLVANLLSFLLGLIVAEVGRIAF